MALLFEDKFKTFNTILSRKVDYALQASARASQFDSAIHLSPGRMTQVCVFFVCFRVVQFCCTSVLLFETHEKISKSEMSNIALIQLRVFLRIPSKHRVLLKNHRKSKGSDLRTANRY